MAILTAPEENADALQQKCYFSSLVWQQELSNWFRLMFRLTVTEDSVIQLEVWTPR